MVDPVDAEVTHAGLGFIEVLPPGITKASGLAIALERYGVGFGDVLVFGDMPNDLPMIAAVSEAGGRAVAVANAHPAVRAATPQRHQRSRRRRRRALPRGAGVRPGAPDV